MCLPNKLLYADQNPNYSGGLLDELVLLQEVEKVA
jgi:hypothetical protein